MELIKEFFNKYLKGWVKKDFNQLTNEQREAIKEIPAYQAFVKSREKLLEAVKGKK